MCTRNKLVAAGLLLSLVSGWALALPPYYRITRVGPLGDLNTDGWDMNSLGQVTGGGRTTALQHHAFLWNGIAMRDLGTFGGTFGIGLDINNAGQVSGWAGTTGDVARHAFIWDRTKNPPMRDVGTLGGRFSMGLAINAFGQVTGQADTAGNAAAHAYRWNGTAMQDLGTLGGRDSGGGAINIFGQVTGWSDRPVDADGELRVHAFLWDGIAMRDLGTLGGPVSAGVAINAAGQVTGYAFEPPTGEQQYTHAFLWDGTAMYDLNKLIDPADPLRSRFVLIEGRKINNRGQILVRGKDPDEPDYDETFVLSPVLGYDLKSFTINKSEVAGCMNVTGKVTLSRAAPAGGVVVTRKDTLAAVSTPMTVKILEGLTSKSFTIKTTPVSTAQSGVLGAILGGSTITKDLKVRPMGMSSVALTPNPVVGTNNVAGTAKLECKAGPGSIQVSLASNNAAIAKPTQSSITVPVGVQSAAFTVTTSKVTANKNVTISATSNDIKISKVLTVTP